MRLFIIFNIIILIIFSFLEDIFYFGQINVLFEIDNSLKSMVKLTFFNFFLFYIILNIKNIKKLALSIFLFIPVIAFNRELIQIKTFSYTLSLVELTILFNSVFIIYYIYKNKNHNDIYNFNGIFINIIILLIIGVAVSFFHQEAISFNGFYLSYLFPLLYFILLLELNFFRDEIIKTSLNMMLISVFIFCLQNLYIGPMTVYYSSINQTWLGDNISIANGGLLEIGTMQTMLIPIAFYFIYNESKLIFLFSKTKILLIHYISYFILMMPFIYHNRANSLLVLFFLAYLLKTKSTANKKLLITIFLLPFILFLLTDLFISRSFVSDGREITLLGITLSNLDYTTYNHLNSTVNGFTLILENLFFGLGSFQGLDSYSQDFFKISNMRNFLIPTIEIALYYGIIFYFSYILLVRNIYIKTDEQLLKLLLLIQFIPIIGSNRFFGLYATGTLNLNLGFASLNDYVPISIFSIFTLLNYLLFITHYKKGNVLQ